MTIVRGTINTVDKHLSNIEAVFIRYRTPTPKVNVQAVIPLNQNVEEAKMYNYRFNECFLKGSHNSVMMDKNKLMPSLLAQLNAGICVLEFDFHPATFPKVQYFQLGHQKYYLVILC